MIRKMLRERARAQAVDRLGVIEAPGGPLLDRFVKQAATAFAAPIAVATMLRDRRLWVKAGIGLPPGCMSRDDSFCTHALDSGDVFEVCDASLDPVFRNLPAVTGDLGIRYYIGAPLHCAGEQDVGMLCVLDTRPRPPASEDQRAYLSRIARLAVDAIEQHARLKGGVVA